MNETDRDWQAPYERELLRTAGKTVRWERRKGRWWYMHVEGHSLPASVRRNDVERFTSTLKGRADGFGKDVGA